MWYKFCALSFVLFELVDAGPSKDAKLQKIAKIAERVNSAQSSWEASDNYQMTFDALDTFTYSYCDHSKGKKPRHIKKYSPAELEDLPKEFDARKSWPKCKSIGTIRDQSHCGSCWAFGVVEAISDRICINSTGKKHPTLSAIHLTSCSRQDDGCDGGHLETAYSFYKEEGIVTGGRNETNEGCLPYPWPSCSKPGGSGHYPPCKAGPIYVEPPCQKKCRAGYPVSFEKDHYFGEEAYALESPEQIMKDIMEHGPVTAGFFVYEDFMSYKKGVYEHIDGDQLGGHAIKILGWGIEDEKPFWLCANSWNEEWGDKGFFKILRGSNHVDIEGNVIASLPRKE